MLIEFLIFIGGLTILYFGAEWMVEGSSSMALRFGITPIIVGCTVVAFGTSMPELVVSLAAVITESDDISIGNIIGSNIANLALILGTAALIRPIEVHSDIIKREFPVMIAASILFCVLAMDSEISRFDGFILVTCMVGYLGFMLSLARKSMKASAAEKAEDPLLEVEVDPNESTNAKDLVKVIGGILGLTFGAHFMVQAAVTIASSLGVPQLVIGISIVALGTSLPELATSVVAAAKDESDISVGNVIGSNIFNILSVIGIVGSIAAMSVGRDAVDFDLWIMLAIAMLAWPIMWARKRISRFEGAIMVLVYLSYNVWIYLR